LLLPTGAWLLDELQFRRSGAAVVETLEGELRGEAIADTVLLVRTTGCTPTTSGSGSAFVVDVGSGPVIVTNRHVVDDARQVGVRNLDGTSTLQVARILVSDSRRRRRARGDRPGGAPASAPPRAGVTRPSARRCG
jgi:hypothetical protein